MQFVPGIFFQYSPSTPFSTPNEENITFPFVTHTPTSSETCEKRRRVQKCKKNKKTKTSLLLPPLCNHHTFSFSLFFVLSVAACLSFPISHDHLLALALQFSKITLFHSTGAKYYLNAAMQRWSGAIYQPLWLYSNALNNRMHWCNAGIQGYKSLVFVFSAHLEQIVA